MKIIFLGLGSNLGSRESNLSHAIEQISEHIGNVKACSSMYETEPWGFQSDDLFLNMALKVESDLSPGELLHKILKIESTLGRLRGDKRYSSRVIDIDILLFDNLIVETEDLTVPHPLLHERKFVLVPLCDIASEVKHPVLKKNIKELLEICEDRTTPKKVK